MTIFGDIASLRLRAQGGQSFDYLTVSFKRCRIQENSVKFLAMWIWRENIKRARPRFDKLDAKAQRR